MFLVRKVSENKAQLLNLELAAELSTSGLSATLDISGRIGL